MPARCLQVSVKEIDEANTIFDELMGDKVEPRRVFIEDARARGERGRVTRAAFWVLKASPSEDIGLAGSAVFETTTEGSPLSVCPIC